MTNANHSTARRPRAASNRAATAVGKVSSRPRAFRDTELPTLALLKSDQCKWPVGYNAKALGNYLFCGQQTDGRSYCVKHQRLNLSKRKH